MLQEMKIEMPMPSIRCMEIEAVTYLCLGKVAIKGGLEESCQDALVQLGKGLKLSKAINFARGIACAEYCITDMKSKFGRDTSRNKRSC